MKLKKEFIIHHTGGESLLVPTGEASFRGLVQGNKTLGALLTLLNTETTESEIVAAMVKKYDAPEAVIRQDVAKALAQLRGIGAIDE